MSKLIICDTLYQIITAIHMKCTIFGHEDIDIWISDHSMGTEDIVYRLREEKIFRDVFYVSTKNISYSNCIFYKIKNTILYGFGIKVPADLKKYDEILYYGLSLIIYGIAECYRKENISVVWSRYEEGILSYDTDLQHGKCIAILQKLRHVLKRPQIEREVKNYYCFFPELKETHKEWNFIKIPQIETDFISKMMYKRIFNYHEQILEQKYIFFATSSDIDGNPCGETGLVMKIADYVGKENLIVKMHPRDDRQVYRDNNILTMDSIGIPWEVFQLCGELNNKILLTIDSGAFLSITAILPCKGIKGAFLFPCATQESHYLEQRGKKIRKILDKLHAKGLCKNIQILEKIDEVVTYVEYSI